MSPTEQEIDSLESLEERIQQTVQLVSRLRRERDAALEQAGQARSEAARLAEADGLYAALDDHTPADHRGMLPPPAGRRRRALLPLRRRCYPPVVRRSAVDPSF